MTPLHELQSSLTISIHLVVILDFLNRVRARNFRAVILHRFDLVTGMLFWRGAVAAKIQSAAAESESKEPGSYFALQQDDKNHDVVHGASPELLS